MYGVSVDVREMQEEVRRGLSCLARARETVNIDAAVLSGTPCVKGTRIGNPRARRRRHDEHAPDARRDWLPGCEASLR